MEWWGDLLIALISAGIVAIGIAAIVQESRREKIADELDRRSLERLRHIEAEERREAIEQKKLEKSKKKKKSKNK